MRLWVTFLIILMTTAGFAAEESTNLKDTPVSMESETQPILNSNDSAEAQPSSAKPALVAEDEIPININTVKKANSTESSMGRLIMVLGLMVVVAGGAYFFAKKYGRPSQNQQTQIRVLTQHYLGPKKSLAIIRVAGESVLIGVTDNSITLIKSLALLDDEIPETSEGPFEKLMQDKEKVQQMGSEEFSIRHIKDVVSLKLKGMRNEL